MRRSYKRPDPHPIFEAIDEEARGEPLTMIEGFVCPSSEGILSIVPRLDMRTRFDIAEADVIYVESAGGEEQHKVRVHVSENADVSVYEHMADELSVKAVEVSIAQVASGLEDMLGGIGVVWGSETDKLRTCYSNCAAKKRHCQGFFPNAEKIAECQKAYDACIKKCSEGGGSLVPV